jgi:cell division protein FtsL
MAVKRKKKKATGKSHTWIWVLVLTLFIGELLFYTWCRVQCTQTGIAISAERDKQQQLSTLANSLNIELARLKAPERISYIAKQKLGLQMPDPNQTILVP